MKRRVLFITGSRAEYGLLRKLILASATDNNIAMSLIVTGSHLSTKHGLTYKDIEKDKIKPTQKINISLHGDSPMDVINSMSIAMKRFSNAFLKLKPDLIVILGDRYEIFSAASAAMILNLPIAHIHGGEVTEGAYDEAIRHSITKISHLHFVATEDFRKRIIQLGENPKTVFNVGGLGVDAVQDLKLLSKAELEKNMNLKFATKNLLVTVHPETRVDKKKQYKNMKTLLAALKQYKEIKYIFTMPNADQHNEQIANLIKAFCFSNSSNSSFYSSLGQLTYLSCLKYIDGVLGTSSSGLLEVPSFMKGTINIGSRQSGRPKASSIIDCEFNKNEILNAINKLYSSSFQKKLSSTKNPYGKPGASKKILKKIKTFPLNNLLNKKFHDL
jgi:GDP/UDP-N,N'-diacetylbacillosamine 2-epimerase (hydrolysing)